MPSVAIEPATGQGQPKCELADVFRQYGNAYRQNHRLPLSHHKVMNAIQACRTAALGGQRQWCNACQFERYVYHSCRNRHCPKCQTMTKQQWLEDRKAQLIPVPYFHVVFTLPHELNPTVLANKSLMLNLLFQATAQTLTQFVRNEWNGRAGFTLILHTWDRTLGAHFHLHGVIPGGALGDDGSRWIPGNANFLFWVGNLSKGANGVRA